MATTTADDRKVRFTMARSGQQQQQQQQQHLYNQKQLQIPRPILPPGSPTNGRIVSQGRGALVHGTTQYVNGTLVTEVEEEATTPAAVTPATSVASTLLSGLHLKSPQSLFTSKRSNSACQIVVGKKPSLIPNGSPVPPPKTSIMKKPSLPRSPSPVPRQLKANREPIEVRKLVTFTDLIQYVDEEEEEQKQQERIYRNGLPHSEEDLQKLRQREKGGKSKMFSRTKMISSISAPNMKSFNKLKGIKNVGGHNAQLPTANTKSFRIISDSQLPPFKELFDSSQQGKVKTTTAINANLKTKAGLSLPTINVNLVNNANNASPSTINQLQQDSMYLKVPKLRAVLNASNNSGSCGFDFDVSSTSFKVFDRTLADGSLESFYEDSRGPVVVMRRDAGDVDALPEVDVEQIIDEVNLMQFWESVEKWQNIHREQQQQAGSDRMGYDNVLFLNNLRNELLLEGTRSGRNNNSSRSVVNRRIARRIVEMSGPDKVDGGVNGKLVDPQEKAKELKSEQEKREDLRIAMQNEQNKQPVDRLPLVTTLLRASRDGNDVLIKSALRDIIINGITKEELNSTDKSGRTAISYICSNGLIQFLDIMLQLPNIDANKADNEGNTPLHFAAEAGRSETINMLITRCRTLKIDKKNNLGFTPLMKAALQGRTKCAKLLLFAGASPLETDPKRQYRADQWAKFCGQYACAEMIETSARTRLLEKSPSLKWETITAQSEKKFITRTNTGTLVTSTNGSPNGGGGSSGGIRSKLRKVFPFGMALKDKSAGNNIAKNKRSETSDIVSYLSAAALSASSGPALSKDQSALIKNLIHYQDVPKLEVTYANNNTLIKKLENSRYTESDPQSPVAVKTQ